MGRKRLRLGRRDEAAGRSGLQLRALGVQLVCEQGTGSSRRVSGCCCEILEERAMLLCAARRLTVVLQDGLGLLLLLTVNLVVAQGGRAALAAHAAVMTCSLHWRSYRRRFHLRCIDGCRGAG